MATFLTGGRLRFGTHHIDNTLKESEFFVQKVSTGETVQVKLNPSVYPTEVKIDEKIESGEFTPQGSRPLSGSSVGLCPATDQSSLGESFIVEKLDRYRFPGPLCPDLGKRRDNDFKDVQEN